MSACMYISQSSKDSRSNCERVRSHLHDQVAAVATDALRHARERLLHASSGEVAESLLLDRLVRALWRLAPPTPVDACFPLFLLYTSGSTGKPRVIVHTHGGYEVGLCTTSQQVVFDLQSARDTFLAIATPGWITGQSYMIAAALLCRVPSVQVEGSPVSTPDRFAATIERHSVSVLKAGSTFLRMLMTMPGGDAILQRHDLSSLRLGTFCAAPVHDAVDHFAITHVTPTYIHSYGATEHGGIVWSPRWSCCHGNEAQPLRADTRTWSLPWIVGDVLRRADDDRWSVAPAGVAEIRQLLTDSFHVQQVSFDAPLMQSGLGSFDLSGFVDAINAAYDVRPYDVQLPATLVLECGRIRERTRDLCAHSLLACCDGP